MATIERLEALAEAARISAQIAAEDREARDREIEDADASDRMGIRVIARATKLSPSHVSKITATRTAQRQAAM
ncbi:hypothetical protein [Fodinicola feengrottensis]|nr:hypothetical protein [Fodinicola feengrottensis]